MTVEQLILELKKDTSNFRRSGGGITLSGGEPLGQWKFATELLKACKSQGWHTAMETTGLGSDDAIENVFPHVDLVLLDIKAMDPEIHKKATGVSNELIQKNARRITEITNAVIRVPTIPEINATEAEFIKISDFAKSLNHVETIHLLPYHTYGENKYELLGVDYPMGEIKPLDEEHAAALQAVVQSQGLNCVIGG
jgi:pyruvate formate lyase activating enzyme